MINYTTPGVFIEEIPATGPIAGVGTSTAAFIGPALFGPINIPTRITNWTQLILFHDEDDMLLRHPVAPIGQSSRTIISFPW